MQILNSQSYPDEFKAVINKIKKKYNEIDLIEVDGIGNQLDVNKFSKEFFSTRTKTAADVSVDANANVEEVTVLQYMSEINKPIHRLNSYYLLWKYARSIFSAEIAEKMITAQLTKQIYIHDSQAFTTAYCFNFSCMDVVCAGLPFTRKVVSNPAKNLSSFMGQMINFITYAGNNVAGACGVADLLICMSWYVEKLRDDSNVSPTDKNWRKAFIDKQIRQELQSFIYSVNQPFRGGVQSFFTNISIYDDTFLDKFCDEYHFPDGKQVKKETVKELQELYVDLMNEILEESPVTFPVTTACLAVDGDLKVLDKNFLEYIAEKNMKYGFMNIYAGKTSTLSSCCRLRNDTADNEYFNSFGSGGSKVGSIGVVTLNLPRIAYTSKNREEFLETLQELVQLASKINHVKRHLIKKRIDGNHYPLYTLGFMNLKKQYSTAGLVGINETCEIMGTNILNKDGQELVFDILDIVNKTNSIQEKKYKYPHNCEQVPAENVAVKLAYVDKMLGYNKDYTLYSNQFIPLTTNADILERIKLQGLFDKHMTGGAIAHLNIVEEITDVKFMINLIKLAINSGVVYHAVNYNLLKCENGHITVGKSAVCNKCGADITDSYTRVVGFLVNTKNFNKVRRVEDYPNRVFSKSEEIKV